MIALLRAEPLGSQQRIGPEWRRYPTHLLRDPLIARQSPPYRAGHRRHFGPPEC